MDKQKMSLGKIALLQAAGVVLYCGLVGLVFWRGNEWFGAMPNYLGPVLVLLLLVVSVLIVALLTLGYPVILIWREKKVVEGVKLIAYTAAMLAGLVMLVMLFLAAS